MRNQKQNATLEHVFFHAHVLVYYPVFIIDNQMSNSNLKVPFCLFSMARHI